MIRNLVNQCFNNINKNSFTTFNSRSYCINNNNNLPVKSNRQNNKNKDVAKTTIIRNIPQIFSQCINYMNTGQYKKAENSLVQVHRAMQSRIYLDSSYFEVPHKFLGLLAHKMGKYATSEQFTRNSLVKNQSFPNVFFKMNRTESINHLALTLFRQGRYIESLTELNEVKALAESKQYDNLLPSIYVNIAEYYKDFDNDYAKQLLAKAHIAMKNLYGLNTSIGHSLDMARIYLNRGQIYRIDGLVEEGKAFFNQGVTILTAHFNKLGLSMTKTPEHNDWAKALIELGHFYYKDGLYENAIMKLKSASNIFKTMGNLNTPDSIFNLLNIALIQKQHNPLNLDPKANDEYVNQILTSISKGIYDLKKEKLATRYNKMDTVIDNLKESSNTSQIELLYPHHFQLSNGINKN